MELIELVIKDVPNIESVKEEIVNNAITTIVNYKRSQVPISAEALAVEEEIAVIRDKNIEVKPIAEEV